MGKLTIFLSYHKNSPCYKSEVFLPIQVGAENSEKIDFALHDNEGENISTLNPYYCELTGHYWVLKNYLKTCNTDDYIGFAHYRRLPDLDNISDKDFPAIYGMGHSESVEFFKKLNTLNLYELCKPYDVIYPCSCYMYKNTVNPQLRDNEEHFDVYEHFRQEHGNDLLDVLKDVIQKYYPDYTTALEECYKSEKSHFYNIYIMKRDLLEEFLNWQFDILEKIGNIIGGWKQEKYRRMAGFVGETLINIWLGKNKSLKTGYVLMYMIDFEAEHINTANTYYSQGEYQKAINELEILLEYAADKFSIYLSIADMYGLLREEDKVEKYLGLAKENSKDSDDLYSLIQLYIKTGRTPERITALFDELLSGGNNEKLYAKAFLTYAEKLHNAETTKKAWEYLKKFELTEEEKEKYNNFKKIYEMLKS